jgi:two-component system response regulator AtoC
MKLGDSAVVELAAYRWPGNVRQLRNMIERLVAMAPERVIEAKDVRRELEEVKGSSPLTAQVTMQDLGTGRMTFSATTPLDDQLVAVERRALERALERAGGSKLKAAKLLGIGRTTLYMKLTQHGLL